MSLVIFYKNKLFCETKKNNKYFFCVGKKIDDIKKRISLILKFNALNTYFINKSYICNVLRVFKTKVFTMTTNYGIHKQLLIFLLGVSIEFLFFSCNNVVEEPDMPPQQIELHSGYNVQLYSVSGNVNWGSDNPAVATVSSTGLVTAVGAGKAAIYTYTSVEDKNIICYLDVLPRRNILFYIGADEYLINGDAPGKINKIRSGWEPGKGEMLIYIDRQNSGASLLRIDETIGDNGLYKLDTLHLYGSENSADPDVLKRVINTVNTEYPADSYGMIFFSHGSGWLPSGTLNSPRSLVIDKGSSMEMEYSDFAAAIPDGQFDFIILEACLMADVMFMYDLRNKADYVLASSAEIVQPGFTDIYEEKVMSLFDTRSTVSTVLSSFAQAYYDTVTTQYGEIDAYCSVTMSLMKMDEMEKLAQATKNALNGIDIYEENIEDIYNIQSFDRPNTGTFGWQRPRCRFFDLTHTMENIVPDAEYRSFLEQMNKTVIWKASTKRFLLGNLQNGQPNYSEYDGFMINRHCGLTTYIKQDAYPYLNSKFEESSWYKSIR